MRGSHLRNGIQQLMQEAGEAACYALCLIDVAMEYISKNGIACNIDVTDALYDGCDRGYIYFNSANLLDDNNMYVRNPEAFLNMLTGKTWRVSKGYDLKYSPESDEYIIKRYERSVTGKTFGHFDRDAFHPIIDSQTVRSGRLVSLRICTVLQ